MEQDIIHGWLEFRVTMLGVGLSPQQIDGMKSAFWSGAIWALRQMHMKIESLEKQYDQDHARKNVEA